MTDRVFLRLQGNMLERFIGRAVQEGVCFQVIERGEGRQMRLAASGRDAARLMRLAEEYRMDLTNEGEQGWPYRMRRLRARATLAPGLLLGLMLVVGFTSRIWRVEAVALDNMADAALLRAIEESVRERGVSPGTLRKNVDRDLLALDIQAERPELTHVSVQLDGVTLRVEVAAEKAAPEVYEAAAGRDLVALTDAVIVYVEPLAGKAAVKPGDTVRRGQVLIRGEERIDAEATRGVRALGTVMGRVWFDAECRLPLAEMVREPTGNVRVSSELRIGGWSLPVAQAEDFACQETGKQVLPIGGLYVPVRIVRTVRREMLEREVAADTEAMLAQGAAWALELARGKIPEAAMETGCWTEHSETDKILTVRATIEAQMNIAGERSELTDDSQR